MCTGKKEKQLSKFPFLLKLDILHTYTRTYTHAHVFLEYKRFNYLPLPHLFQHIFKINFSYFFKFAADRHLWAVLSVGSEILPVQQAVLGQPHLGGEA